MPEIARVKYQIPAVLAVATNGLCISFAIIVIGILSFADKI